MTPKDKLKSYTALAAAALASAPASAQLIYTDISPDITLTDTGMYVLDMDNNMNPELAISNFTDSSGNVSIVGLQLGTNPQTAVLGSLYQSSYPFPFALNNGDSIRPNAPTWNDASINSGAQYLAVVAYTMPYCNFLGVNDKYLGIRFTINNQLHYGWARLSVPTNARSFTIKDYAYNSVANQGLTAGESGVGISEQEAIAGLSVYAYQGQLTIQSNADPLNEAKVRVMNSTGQVVREEQFNGDSKFDLSALATGIYLIEVQSGDRRVVKKVYIN